VTPNDLAAAATELRDIPGFPIFAYVPSVTEWIVLGVALGAILLLFRIDWRARRRSADPFALVGAALERPVSRESVFAASRAIKRLLAACGRGDFTALSATELRAEAAQADAPVSRGILAALATLEEAKFAPFDARRTGEAFDQLRALVPKIRDHAEVDRAGGGEG